jgi:SAM-dependent methyltransferase
MNPAEFANIARVERDFWWHRGMRAIAFTLLDEAAQKRSIRQVLEAGCGTGYFASQVEARYGWQVTALDVAYEGVSHATVLRRVQADIRQLPFREDFEAVLCLDVLVHFARGEEAAALQEFSRVLRPGGVLLLRVAALDALRSRHSEFAHERQRFTRTRLIQAVTRAGLRVVRCTYANSLLLPVAWFKFRLWEPLWNSPPASGLQELPGWLNRLLEVPLKLEARAVQLGINLPLGQSLILVAEKGRLESKPAQPGLLSQHAGSGVRAKR